MPPLPRHFFFLSILFLISIAKTPAVTINWLGSNAPATSEGVSWGVPWPKGKVQKNDPLTLRTSTGKTIPLQSWPLAYWPDGSIKWSGHAISAGPAINEALEVVVGDAPASGTPIKVTTNETTVEIDTGATRCRFSKQGTNLFDSLFVGERKVAENARLTLRLEDRSEETNGVLRQVEFTSRITGVTLEQAGPIRAVVKVEGLHFSAQANRSWLPFTTRFYFYAGQESVRIVHSFVFDGNQEKDFIKGMGISVTVPFQEELQNRHVRFAGDGTGVWCQPVRLLPGYRNALNADDYADHLAGKRMQNLTGLRARAAAESVAVYDDFKLTQLGPDGFSIDKRTQNRSSWLHVSNGRRSLGLGVLADVSGGVAIGIKDFWQKYPASIEINRATTSAGEITAWIWSPDGPAMDMRTYDNVPHGLQTSYEDWKPGWGTAEGVAHTTELTLWAFAAIPSNAELVHMAKAGSAPATLVCTPDYYHSIPVFGRWSLPDKSSPTKKWVEDQLEQLFTFYRDQVEQRTWYGFWDFGDIMHNYDFGRHDWRYDIGGWAWANTELMPDMFLWETFLRSGRADAFRMAEAMTRHTSEVDVHHSGFFAPLGSRHNVNHWGDGAKQPRISHAMLKRYMYYLSGGDERLGDLMREQLDADLAYDRIQRIDPAHFGAGQYNAAQYPPGEIAQRRGGFGRGGGNNFGLQTNAPGADSERRDSNVRFGLEWICYSINWMTEWERTGNPIWRDRVLAGMKTIVANGQAGRSNGRSFDIIFGGPEILFEEESMFDYPEFWAYWTRICEGLSTSGGGNMTGPRAAAYAAFVKKDATLGKLAWDKLIGDARIDSTIAIPQPRRSSGPEVVHPVDDPVFLGKSAGWQLHGVASIQWALNAIETLELAGEYLPAWETAPRSPAAPESNPPTPAATTDSTTEP